QPPARHFAARVAQRAAARGDAVGRPARLRAGGLDPGGTRLRHARPRLRHGDCGERARRVRDAKSGVPLCRRLRAAQHWGRSDLGVGRPADTLRMSTTTQDAVGAQVPEVRIARASGFRRIARGLRWFARRSPMSAFWGLIAAAIVVIAVAAPAIAPYDPLKSDFRPT